MFLQRPFPQEVRGETAIKEKLTNYIKKTP